MNSWNTEIFWKFKTWGTTNELVISRSFKQKLKMLLQKPQVPLCNFPKNSQGSNSTRHVIFISPSLLFNSPLFFPENKLSATMECFEFKKHRKIMKHFACVQQQNLKVLSCSTNLFLRTRSGPDSIKRVFFNEKVSLNHYRERIFLARLSMSFGFR